VCKRNAEILEELRNIIRCDISKFLGKDFVAGQTEFESKECHSHNKCRMISYLSKLSISQFSIQKFKH